MIYAGVNGELVSLFNLVLVWVTSLTRGVTTLFPNLLLGMLDSIPVDKITAWDADFQEHLQSQQGPLLEEISKGLMTKDLEEKSTLRFVFHLPP